MSRVQRFACSKWGEDRVTCLAANKLSIYFSFRLPDHNLFLDRTEILGAVARLRMASLTMMVRVGTSTRRSKRLSILLKPMMVSFISPRTSSSNIILRSIWVHRIWRRSWRTNTAGLKPGKGRRRKSCSGAAVEAILYTKIVKLGEVGMSASLA